jgi:anthranilate/para-aminobenzoate synthase component II
LLLMIDNYDSFTYNIVQYLGELGAEVKVYRNDCISIDEIKSLAPKQIVISPGPCTPNEAGISKLVIEVTKVSARFLGAILCRQKKLCMENFLRFITLELEFLVSFLIHLLRLVTTHWLLINFQCQTV